MLLSTSVYDCVSSLTNQTIIKLKNIFTNLHTNVKHRDSLRSKTEFFLLCIYCLKSSTQSEIKITRFSIHKL